MKLGLRDNEMIIVRYNLKWKTEFKTVKSNIIDQTGMESCRIEYIGSTAIEGIKAKPIIDILIGIDSLEKIDSELFDQLKSIGFYRLRVQKDDETVCAKFTDETFEVKTHIIHIVVFNKDKWKQLTFFRDYLNDNLTKRKQYELIKDEFIESGQTGINQYTDYIERFVSRIIAKL